MMAVKPSAIKIDAEKLNNLNLPKNLIPILMKSGSVTFN